MKLKGRKVLVTGAGGFIGSHLVERLVQERCQLRAMVHYNALGSWGWLDRLPAETRESIEVIAGDIRDPFWVKASMAGVDVVFHLAALIGIPFSYYAPASYLETNVKGTLHVLQAARDASVERVLVTSTSEVCGTARYVPIDESHPRQAQSPYAASKIAADALADAFHRSFDLPVVIVRPFNTYGPRQSARAFIPTVITQLLGGSRELKIGDLSPKRDLLYVKDTVDGFVALARAEGVAGREVNPATGKAFKVGEVAAKLIRLLAPRARIVQERRRFRPAQSEVRRLLGSGELCSRLTGWRPRWSLDEGLEATAAWFREAGEEPTPKTQRYNV